MFNKIKKGFLFVFLNITWYSIDTANVNKQTNKKRSAIVKEIRLANFIFKQIKQQNAHEIC